MNNDRINIFINSLFVINKVQYMYRDPTLDEDTNLQFPRLQSVLCQAVTWTSQGTNLVNLRHQPLGLQPYLWYRLQPVFLMTPIL